jgi:hypothetical protein
MVLIKQASNAETAAERSQRRKDLLAYGKAFASAIRDRQDFSRLEQFPFDVGHRP